APAAGPSPRRLALVRARLARARGDERRLRGVDGDPADLQLPRVHGRPDDLRVLDRDLARAADELLLLVGRRHDDEARRDRRRDHGAGWLRDGAGALPAAEPDAPVHRVLPALLAAADERRRAVVRL